jgi:pilus assembly protein CpaF
MIQAMTSGHAGSMSTLHANQAMDALNRLETLAMMNPIEMPLHALRAQIASAIDVIVLMTRFSDGPRGLTQIAEVLPLGGDGKYRIREVFRLELDAAGRGTLVWTGEKSSFRAEPKIRMLSDRWDLTREIFEGDDGGDALAGRDEDR